MNRKDHLLKDQTEHYISIPFCNCLVCSSFIHYAFLFSVEFPDNDFFFFREHQFGFFLRTDIDNVLLLRLSEPDLPAGVFCYLSYVPVYI